MRDDSRGTLLPGDSSRGTNLPAGRRQIGPYRLLSELGRGAMGTVYEAEHSKLKRRVALKVLPDELAASADLYARFQREMEAIGRLEHANIVLATDAGQSDGVCFIAMQLIRGVDLAKILEECGRLTVPEACEVVRQVALGLQEIHLHGMIHRDIKPSNLLLATQGEMKILDLGIASLRDTPGADDSLTKTGGFLGTPDYVAPEQIVNRGPLDIRADIYSLGCTLYHLLSGQAPFSGDRYDSFPGKLLGHTEHSAASLSSLGVIVPPEVANIVNRMMAKDPNDRFPTPAAVAAALEAYGDAKALMDLAALDGASRNARGTAAGRPPKLGKLGSRGKRPNTRWSGRMWLVPAAVAVCSMAYIGWRASDANRPSSLAPSALKQPSIGDEQPPVNEPPPANEPPANELSANEQVSGEGETGELTNRDETDRELAATAAATPQADETAEPKDPAAAAAAPSRESDAAIALNTQAIAAEAKKLNATVEDIRESGETVAQNTAKIALTLEQMQTQFSQAIRQPAADPQTPSEWYANAIQHAQSGNVLAARRAYLKFFSFGLNVVDPFQSFATLLRLQEGVAGARETFSAIPGDRMLPARRLVDISLQPSEQRRALLEALLEEAPEFGPAYYALAKTYDSNDAWGTQLSLGERMSHKQALQNYWTAHERGQVLRHYLDQSQAKLELEPAEKKLRSLSGVTQELLDNPVTLETHFVVDRFLVHLQFAEGAQNVGYRLASTDEFTMIPPPPNVPAGALSGVAGPQADAIRAFSKLTTVAEIELPATAGKSVWEVKYKDRVGVARGPFRLQFDPEAVKLEYAFRYLKTRSGNAGNPANDGYASDGWVEIEAGWSEGEPTEIWFNGLLTLSWRAVKSVRYGVNVEKPNRDFPVPRAEYGRETMSQFYAKVNEKVRFVTLQVTLVDGQTTPIFRYEAEP